MYTLPEDILLYISKFLHNNTCCTYSELHNLSLTNKFNYHMYKENIAFLPLVPIPHQKKIYSNIVTSLHFNCYLCGPFNKTELSNIIDSIRTAIGIRAWSSPPVELPRSFPFSRALQNTIHSNSSQEMEILKAKVNALNENLNFIIAGKCCKGKGATLYIKH